MIPFGPEIWTVDGPEVSFAGFAYPTRMTVVRLESGALWVWSPITLTADIMAALAELGPVAHIVAPNHLHHLALSDWQVAYPDAQFHAAPKLADKRSDIRFASTLGDVPHDAWAGEIDQVVVRGNLITTEVVFFHNASGTVIFTDLIQQFPRGFHSGWRAVVARLDLMVHDRPTVPRKFRAAFVKREAARETLRRIKDWPAERVIMAHGPTVTTGAKGLIERAFDWL